MDKLSFVLFPFSDVGIFVFGSSVYIPLGCGYISLFSTWYRFLNSLYPLPLLCFKGVDSFILSLRNDTLIGCDRLKHYASRVLTFSDNVVITAIFTPYFRVDQMPSIPYFIGVSAIPGFPDFRNFYIRAFRCQSSVFGSVSAFRGCWCLCFSFLFLFFGAVSTIFSKKFLSVFISVSRVFLSFSVSLCIDIFRVIVYCYLTTNKQPPTKPSKTPKVDNNLTDFEKRIGGTDRKEKNDMKRTENFFLNDECDFAEGCLRLLNIPYERNDNATDKKTDMKVYQLTFTATDEQYKAVAHMMMAR